MAKTLKVTWLGDGSPEAQMITEAGIRFIKGEAVSVPDDHKNGELWWADMFRGNPTFAVDDEPDDTHDAPDEAAEKAALKDELRLRGVNVQGNLSLETLRHKLATATK